MAGEDIATKDSELSPESQCLLSTERYLVHETALFEIINSLLETVHELDSPKAVLRAEAERMGPPLRDALISDIDSGEFDRRLGSSEAADKDQSIEERNNEITETLAKLKPEALAALSPSLFRLMVRPSRASVLYRSLLVTAVANFEIHLAGVFRAFYTAVPEALRASNTTFTISEIDQFESIDEFIAAQIEDKVDSLMLQDLDKWRHWLAEQKITDLEKSCIDFVSLGEIFQRRHVIVHNDGKVSKRYIAKCGGDPASIGAPLDTDGAYIDAALDALLVPAVIIPLSLWSRLEPSSTRVALHGLQRCYELMLAERWGPVARIAALCKERAATTSYEYWALQANEWHCSALLNGAESVAPAVRDWNIGGLRPIFRVVRHVLLGELDSAIAAVPAALDNGDLTVDDLRVWPILAALRTHDDFDALVA